MSTYYYKKNYCYKPFEDIEIHPDGSVYTCCPYWNSTSLGNVFHDDVDDIWNSPKAVELRKRILNKDYSLCNTESCLEWSRNIFYTRYVTNCEPIMKELPKKVTLGYDCECNSACIICRDKVFTYSDEKLQDLNSKIDSVYLPFLSNAKLVTINAGGDAFASRHSRLLIKKLIEKIPDLKFEFLTNGIMASKDVFNELNITVDRIEDINISLHASNKKTYAKMVRDGEKKFDIVMKNIKYLSALNKHDDFQLILSFVLTSLNYKDLPDFIKLALKYKAFPVIWEYRPEQNGSQNKLNDILLNITQKTHPHYKDLVKVLHHPIVKEYRRVLAPILQQIQDEKI